MTTKQIADALVQQIQEASPFPSAYTLEAARRVLRRELPKILKEKK